MPGKFSWSLVRRLLVMTLAFVVAVWAMTVAAVWYETRHDLGKLLDAHLAQMADLLAASDLNDAAWDAQPARTPTLVRHNPSNVAFQIWHQGRLMVRSDDAPDAPLASEGAAVLSECTIDGKIWRVLTAVRWRGQGKDVIYVAESVSARRNVLLAALRGMLLPLLLALPLLAIGIWWSVLRATGPLRALSRTVAARQPQALDALPEDSAPPEVRPLVRALNGLFARVAEQLASERRLTADAAHELRTPIAAIRMQAQVAQGATSDHERQVALATTITGCDRAAHLVAQLLQLARLEAEAEGAPAPASAPARCDLAAVASDVVRDLTPVAQARGQRIAWQPPAQPAPVAVSAPLAAVLLRNLLDNALRYSPEGAEVRVEVEPQTAPRLTVQDSGPGMEPAALARLGERFFRVLGSGQSGSGLGWSIVRRIARLHQLQVTVDRSPALGGLRVQVAWPAA